MINHYLIKKLVITITAVLFSSMAWAQNGLRGKGTESNPYEICSQEDWEVFTENINNGINTTAYYILKNDVTLGSDDDPIKTVVGDNGNNDIVNQSQNPIDTTHRFKGHFDGGWHTLTVYIDREEMFAAPFGVVSRATIKNLTVDGVITTTKKFAGGVLSYAVNTKNSPTTITNCTSKVKIVSKIRGDGTHGGLVGQNEAGKIIIENCLFEGSINGPETIKCAGMIGWVNNSASYINCAMAGEISVNDLDETFNRKNQANPLYEKSVYTRDYSDGTQGVPASVTKPANGLYKVYTVNKTDYYLSATTALQIVYPYTGADIPVEVMQTFYGELMVEGHDYSITINDKPGNCLHDIGNYTLKITGKGDYDGTYTTTVSVVDVTTWSGLRTVLGQAASITYTMNSDYTANADNDKALIINGNVVLNMEEHKLDRNLKEKQEEGYVIHVMPGASLTINGGDGAIIKGGNNIGNGGGIYNEGALILNNVIVKDNVANRTDSQYGTGGGVYCQGSNSIFRMDGGELSYNTCHGGGGGVHAIDLIECSISNVTVQYNTSFSKGAGIRVHSIANCNITISNCQIHHNTAKTDNQSMGGGLYFEPTNRTSKMILTDCEIYSNSVTKDGGGIYVNAAGTLELNNCTIRENTASNLGGAAYLHGSADLYVRGKVTIIDNAGKGYNDNLYFNNLGGVINVERDFANTSLIALSRNSNHTGEFTKGLSSVIVEGNYFISDYEGLSVRLSDSGEAEFYTPAVFIKDGNWNDGTKWNTGSVPSAGSDVTIEARATVPNEYTANAGEITMGSGGSITLEDGGQLVSTTSVPVEIKKTINKASVEVGSFAKNCYTLSTPTHDNGSNQQLIENITNLTSYEYDMFKYDEPTNIWLNQKPGGTGFTSMDISTGYIYRNGLDDGIDDIDVLFNGYTNVGSINSYTLTNTNDEGEGFNLIGNPYPHTIYKGVAFATTSDTLAAGYFRLESDGTWSTQTNSTPIEVGEAVFVQASFDGKEGGKLLRFKDRTSAPAAKYNNDVVEFAVSNSEYEDVTYALFDKGVGLNKINHRNPEVQMIYINKDGEDFAIAMMDDATKTFNLNFKAQTTGSYTLSYKTRGEFSYLHVIDRLTGEDVDMLVEDKYSFIGSPKDNEARFIVRLQYHPDYGEGDDIFAYQNGGNVIVRGEGELQVFDVMGRFVMSRKVSGEEAFSMPASGVYIFRLLGEKLRTQKIVVK